MTSDFSSLDIVIVNYRTADMTIRCIASILEHQITQIEHIVVVDNNSPDDSAKRIQTAFPRLRVIFSGRNDGFGAGVNIGISHCSADHILILNPDTYFLDNRLAPLIGFMQGNPKVGIAGLDLINPDGSRQHSARRFYTWLDIAARRVPALGKLLRLRISRHLMIDEWNSNRPFEAEWVMGTGFVVSRSLLDRLGGMDEDYFLYMEDVDLCARTWESGFRVVCLPGVRLVHDHQRSSASKVYSFAGRTHLASLMKFAKKFRVPLFQQPGVKRISRQPG
jgi:GT2 family glycosyltransferase